MTDRVLTMVPLDPAGAAGLFESVSARIESAARRSGGVEVELAGGDRETGGADAVAAAWRRAGPAQLDRLALAGSRLGCALTGLHATGGTLTCLTRGVLQGPYLEIALMADLHLMSPESSLLPFDLAGGYLPCAGGWSRLIGRCGAGRARAFVLLGGPVGAEAALSAGLCDVLLPEGGGKAARPAAIVASSAARLALELADRRARSGSITQRQSQVLERACFALAFASEDPREGISAFFDKRPARFAPPRAAGPDQSTPGGTAT